jgi:micrococcal nuclease
LNVRLIGIDTPETRKPGTPVECGSQEATAHMKKLALLNGRGRTVTLKTDPTQDATDRFGRLLAYVGSAGVDFGRTMISSGGGKTYVFKYDFQRVATYRRAQSSAMTAKRGVWGTCGGNFHSART